MGQGETAHGVPLSPGGSTEGRDAGEKKVPYFEKRIQSGRLLEIERYCAMRDGRRCPRGANREETSAEQAEQNSKQAQKRLMRLINCNFDGRRGDLFVTLTHKGDTTEDEARKAAQEFLRRLRQERKRRGLEELKYIIITECQSGRWHHHIITNAGLTLEDIKTIWGRGRATASILDETYTYAELAAYLTRQTKPRRDTGGRNAKLARPKYGRRWSSSKNLAKPIVTKREIKPIRRVTAPKPPRGYRLLPDWYVGADMWGHLYTHFECVREDNAKSGGRKRE